ncbi:MBL fold metallo-hydrolase [Bacillus sp. XF8]|uniref:MBL fold metallo-hydrolase n=1 Tax=Bacillus sp. XF8 TaxID=2819289 RepID=UPI001AA08946|nr:MBL fold metallo-hydrolase [Bacillus sp. XF8]MBO1582764.1 hypothetical protein [Bacillus sp. XF8]
MKNQSYMNRKQKSRFIAIDVGQGDSFYLEKNNTSILVDGGRSEIHFPKHFRKVVNSEHVDILVCTHNDADHAQGILGFLRSSLTCKEVWLPGSWTTRLTDLLLHPESFVYKLYENIASLETTDTVSDIPQIQNDDTTQGTEADYTLNNSFKCIYDAIEQATLKYDPMLWTDFFDGLIHFMRPLSKNKMKMFLDAITSAKRIRNIAIAAYYKGVKIRWFEFNENYCNGGNPGILEPINSREILSIPPYRPSVLEYIKLTKANKESLVFISPCTNNIPAVLFSADSDFSFNQTIHWSDRMLITAPHHGSESNKNVYKKYHTEAGEFVDIKWVRSDGKYKKRPGNSYLSLDNNCYCTLCRNGKNIKVPIMFLEQLGKWEPKNSTTCNCI